MVFFNFSLNIFEPDHGWELYQVGVYALGDRSLFNLKSQDPVINPVAIEQLIADIINSQAQPISNGETLISSIRKAGSRQFAIVSKLHAADFETFVGSGPPPRSLVVLDFPRPVIVHFSFDNLAAILLKRASEPRIIPVGHSATYQRHENGETRDHIKADQRFPLPFQIDEKNCAEDKERQRKDDIGPFAISFGRDVIDRSVVH